MSTLTHKVSNLADIVVNTYKQNLIYLVCIKLLR